MYAQIATKETKFPGLTPARHGADQKTVNFLKLATTLQKVKPGQTLFAEGDDADAVFEIVQGIMKLYKLLPDGRRQIMGFVSTTNMIGFAQEDAYLYTAEAVTEVSLSRYPRGQFERLVDEVPGFARRVLAARSQDLHSAQDQMLLLGRKTAVERIATFLLHLAKLQAGPQATNNIHVPMTRCDIADYLGLTIETVSRTLSKLKSERVICLPSATEIKLMNRDRLEDLAAGETLELS